MLRCHYSPENLAELGMSHKGDLLLLEQNHRSNENSDIEVVKTLVQTSQSQNAVQLLYIREMIYKVMTSM